MKTTEKRYSQEEVVELLENLGHKVEIIGGTIIVEKRDLRPINLPICTPTHPFFPSYPYYSLSSRNNNMLLCDKSAVRS